MVVFVGKEAVKQQLGNDESKPATALSLFP